MKRLLAPLLVVLAGCTASLPRDGVAPGDYVCEAVTLFGWEHAWPGGSYRDERLGNFDVAGEIREFLRFRRREP